MFHLYSVLWCITLPGFLNCPHHCRKLCDAGAVVMLKSLLDSHCTLATCLVPFLYKITYSSSLNDHYCGCPCLCVWFAASHTKVNSLHLQFVTFFLTLSVLRFVYNESAIVDNNSVIKYIFITILFASFFLFLTLCLCFVKNLGTV